MLGLSTDTNTRRIAGISDLRNPAKFRQTRQPGYQLILKSQSTGVITGGLIGFLTGGFLLFPRQFPPVLDSVHSLELFPVLKFR